MICKFMNYHMKKEILYEKSRDIQKRNNIYKIFNNIYFFYISGVINIYINYYINIYLIY